MPLRLDNPAEGWSASTAVKVHSETGAPSTSEVAAGSATVAVTRNLPLCPHLSVAAARPFGLSKAVAVPRLDQAAAANSIAASTITDGNHPSASSPQGLPMRL